MHCQKCHQLRMKPSQLLIALLLALLLLLQAEVVVGTLRAVEAGTTSTAATSVNFKSIIRIGDGNIVTRVSTSLIT